MARPAGLEPATIRLEGGCSIQLSYGRLTVPPPEYPENGRGREIRTPDILLPKQARYQTALYPVSTEQQVPQQSWRAYYRRLRHPSTTISKIIEITLSKKTRAGTKSSPRSFA